MTIGITMYMQGTNRFGASNAMFQYEAEVAPANYNDILLFRIQHLPVSPGMVMILHDSLLGNNILRSKIQ